MEERKYDLEERTEKFAKDVRAYCKKIKITIINADDVKQLIRSSGSMGANYIEANEHLSKKDFVNRIKICRKESKETRYWFNVMDMEQEDLFKERARLLQEATELMKIFAAILRKSE
jgi:four helix bundle protein